MENLEVELQEEIDGRGPGHPEPRVLEPFLAHEGLVDQGLVVEIPDVLVHSIESSERREELAQAKLKAERELAGVDVGFLDVKARQVRR